MARPVRDSQADARIDAIGHARPVDLLVLTVAVMAICTTGPIIALSAAPALAIAFWRTLAGSAVLAPWAWRGLRAGRPTAREWWLTAVAGALLAVHFATWVPSIRLTTVASSTALVATQPVWAALIARARGMHVPRRTWVGITIALAGVVLLGGLDLAVSSPRALLGDALALIGAITAALYVTVGQEVRSRLPNAVYTSACYGAAAAVLLAMAVVSTTPLVGFDRRDWLLIAAITVTGQLLGHTLMNRALATTSATVVSMAILFEMPGSTVLAAWWVGQVPPAEVWPALLLVLVGIAVVVASGRRARRRPVAGTA